MPGRNSRKQPDQAERFREAARELGADEDKGADELLRRMAKMKPEPRLKRQGGQVTERVVEVHGISETIAVTEKGRGGWWATGTHYGQHIEVEGITEEAAVFAWITRARYLKP